MSVKHYNERRKLYRKTSGPASNPGQPSLTNRFWRRQAKRIEGFQKRSKEMIESMCSPLLDPDPPLKCDCGQCLPGQDRECPARAIARAEYLMEDR